MNSAQRLVRAVSTVTRANATFGKYKKEDAQPVRQLDVTGQTFIEQVKKTRQMLRDMDPETVKQVIEFHTDLTVFEALALAKREGKLIVPNGVHDRILTETKDEVYLRQSYPVWTGTLIIYEEPDEKFGKKVVYSWEADKVKYSVSLEVPKQFRGLRNCALVVEYPDFEVIDLGKNRYELRVSDEQNIHLVQNFAKENGWYLTDHGIPVGAEVASSKNDARYLWRTSGTYSGLLCRGFGDFDNGRRRVVGAGDRPSYVVGVGMVPLAAIPEKSDPHD